MKVLISSIGSRGDVQPILALALELRRLGHNARLCVAPNFRDWVQSFGVDCVPIGPDLKKWTQRAATTRAVKPTTAQLRQLAEQTIREQFRVLTEAAHGCDLIVAGGTLQIAARSIAQALKIPYVFAAYCPAVIPSPNHPPAKMGSRYPQSLPGLANRFLWRRDARSWDVMFLATLNEERVKFDLPPIGSVQRYILTDRPWLASDAALAPAPSTARMQVTQTGAWLLPDPTPLPDNLEQFLANGNPPVYLGFGSMRASEQTSRVLIEATRTLGLRSILSQGWANLTPIDAGTDCICVGDVNHERLFPRVAAIVHHGGAGTTSAAVRAGRPQVIVPHHYDQFYWAHRVEKLGVGVSGPAREHLTVKAIVPVLRESLRPEVARRAQSLASRFELQGARIAAERLITAPLA